MHAVIRMDANDLFEIARYAEFDIDAATNADELADAYDDFADAMIEAACNIAEFANLEGRWAQ